MATVNLKRRLRGAIARRQYATWNEHLHLDRGTGGTNAFIQLKGECSNARHRMHSLTP